MKPFASYFTLEAVADCLVRQRLKLARQRHEAHTLRALGRAAPSPTREVPAPWRGVECLPPRGEWLRPGLDARRGCDSSRVMRRAIHAAIRNAVASGSLPRRGWGGKLLDLTGRVQEAASGPALHRFQPPSIHIEPKAGKKREFRAIASFDDPVDHVLLSLGARCLRDALDPYFLPCSYAFRVPAERDQHDAVAGLLRYRQGRPDRPLFVAECDFRMFYDHVGHDIVRGRLAAALDRAGVDPLAARRLRDLVEAQLAVYTFRGTALAKARELAAASTNGGLVTDLDDRDLAMDYPDPGSVRLGIPQGSALSGVLANLVLHEADEAVMACGDESPPFYARYCDDMILVHEDAGVCRAGLDRFMQAARGLKLVMHPPCAVDRYDAGFYALKSKLPYAWGRQEEGAVRVPWVSFVGYQVRHDGRLRVRKSSLEKEARWQAGKVGQVIDIIRRSGPGLRRKPRSAVLKVEMLLAAHAAGRADVRARHGDAGVSWIRGFKLLEQHPHLAAQLRWLDRLRGRQMARLRGAIAAPGMKASGAWSQPLRPSYCGAPFSYSGAVGRSSPLARLPRKFGLMEYGH